MLIKSVKRWHADIEKRQFSPFYVVEGNSISFWECANMMDAHDTWDVLLPRYWLHQPVRRLSFGSRPAAVRILTRAGYIPAPDQSTGLPLEFRWTHNSEDALIFMSVDLDCEIILAKRQHFFWWRKPPVVVMPVFDDEFEPV